MRTSASRVEPGDQDAVESDESQALAVSGGVDERPGAAHAVNQTR